LFDKTAFKQATYTGLLDNSFLFFWPLDWRSRQGEREKAICYVVLLHFINLFFYNRWLGWWGKVDFYIC